MVCSWLAGRRRWPRTRCGRVDQSSIRADRPWCRAAGAAQSSRRPLHPKAMTHTERARTMPPATRSRGGIGTAAAVVAQGVLAQGEQPPGQRHPGDLGPAALGDLAGEAAQGGVADGAGGRLDQHPAQPARALFGGCGRGGCGRRWCAPQGSARPRSTAAPARGSAGRPRPQRPRWPPSPARPQGWATAAALGDHRRSMPAGQRRHGQSRR